MPDNRKKLKADRKLIALHEPWERRYWTKTLGVTLERLKSAVKSVGPSAAKVRAYMKSDEWTRDGN